MPLNNATQWRFVSIGRCVPSPGSPVSLLRQGSWKIMSSLWFDCSVQPSEKFKVDIWAFFARVKGIILWVQVVFWCSCSSNLCSCVFLPSEHDLGEDDIYDCVPCEDDGDDIYEDIIKVEVRQPMVSSLGIAISALLSLGMLFFNQLS